MTVVPSDYGSYYKKDATMSVTCSPGKLKVFKILRNIK